MVPSWRWALGHVVAYPAPRVRVQAHSKSRGATVETNGQLTIGEVARRAGLQPSAIRYYEQIGLLPAPGRQSGRRRYDPAVLDRLTVIRVGQAAGLTLAEIRELVAA